MNTTKVLTSFVTRTLIASCLIVGMANAANAQADILLQLRSGLPAGDRFRVDSAGGLVALGSLGHGIIPASGGGSRMMWHPFKSAFRVGRVEDAQWNDASVGFYSIAGGFNTTASAIGTVALGSDLTVSGQYATAFGTQNTVSGNFGFAAGVNSQCSDAYCLAIGFYPNAAGQGAIALGYRVTANADYSVAIGYRASTAGRTGAVVFSDASSTDSLQASANNQFSVRAAGGYRFFTNATKTTGVSLAAGGSSWNVISDRNRKENFSALDGEDLLQRLRRVPVTSWNYIDEGRHARHVGPMAQDWHAAFKLNDDNLTINMSDLDGVNLAAVQALESRTTAQAQEISSLRHEIAALKAQQAAMEQKYAELLEAVKRLER